MIVDRLRERFGVEVALKPPRVPYQETIRGPAAAHGRHKKQSGGRGQFGDCHIEIEPLGIAEGEEGFEFVNQIKGGVIPGSFIPAVEKGVREAMESGVLAGYPVKGVRVRLVDGQHHSVDSSEIAFKLAGVQAMKQALELADPVLLEPIMLVTLSVPEAYVGDVIGDLNSRRGRPQGMEPIGAMTEIKAEVPMSEMLTYAPDLRSITAGQGDYTLEFLRYEELPGHLAQKVVEQAGEHARRPAPRVKGLPLHTDGHPHDRHLPARRGLRAVRAQAAAGRAARGLPAGRAAPHRLRAVRAARGRRGLAAGARRPGGGGAGDRPTPRSRAARASAAGLPRRRAGGAESPPPSLPCRDRRANVRPAAAAVGAPRGPGGAAARSRRPRRSAAGQPVEGPEPCSPAPPRGRAARAGRAVFNASEFPRRRRA